PISTSTSSPTAGTAQDVAPILYPNPVKDSGPAVIHLGLAKDADHVEIKLFTTAYRRVRYLAYLNVPAGLVDLPVETKDDWGKPLANGIYYMFLTTPDKKYHLKMLILR